MSTSSRHDLFENFDETGLPSPSHPKTTLHAKKDVLHLKSDPEEKKRRYEFEKMGYGFGSSQYWNLSLSQLRKLNACAINTDQTFTFHTADHVYKDPTGKLYDPRTNFLLMGHDRVETGEWDNLLRRTAPVGFQNCVVIAVNADVVDVPTDPRDGLKVKGKRFNGDWNCVLLGILDCPLDELNKDEYEEQRVYKRTYCFSKLFETATILACKSLHKTGKLDWMKSVKTYHPTSPKKSQKKRCKRKTKSRTKVKKTFGKNKKKR